MSAARTWRIAVMPGDGIGVEVMDATLAVLDRLVARTGLRLERELLSWPSHAYHREHDRMMPEDALDVLSGFDALLMGALGDPGPVSDPERYVLPDGVSLAPLLEIRKGFDLWACERPARPLPGAHLYLADPRAAEVDMLVIRENSEGEYVGQGGRTHRGTADEVATQLSVFTRAATERLIRHAFEQARTRAELRRREGRERCFPVRDGEPASQVCLITKRNALAHWGELYTEVFAEVAVEHPDVAAHHELVDAACMKFVQRPWEFDVVVASNLQGDILTDLAAVLAGGMGVAPSSNLNPDRRDAPPLFEPTHGSAPDIAGQGIADPRAMMLTAAMMLDWMSTDDAAAAAARDVMRSAVSADLETQGGDRRGTREITDAVLDRIG